MTRYGPLITVPKARNSLLLWVQGALAIALPALLAMAPPAEGRMLLVPLAGAAEGALFEAAVTAGAAPIGAGRIPGSLVVEGRRAQLSGELWTHGILILAATPSGCSATQAT